jgi:hypothetical protein
MKKVIILATLVGFVGCGKTPQSMNAEFNSMDNCLSSISKNSGKKLDVVTDKFGEVSGFLEDTKLGFGCKTETTGTKGLVVSGWYQVED